MAQLREQVQTTLLGHRQRVVIPELPIQDQIGERKQTVDQQALLAHHILDQLQFRRQHHLRFVAVLAALGPAHRTGRRRRGLGQLSLAARTGLQLFDLQWIGLSCTGIDQAQREKGHPRNGLAIQRREEPIQPIGTLARFGGHTFIAHQQVHIIRLVQLRPKEPPKQQRPGQRRGNTREQVCTRR